MQSPTPVSLSIVESRTGEVWDEFCEGHKGLSDVVVGLMRPSLFVDAARCCRRVGVGGSMLAVLRRLRA